MKHASFRRWVLTEIPHPLDPGTRQTQQLYYIVEIRKAFCEFVRGADGTLSVTRPGQ